MNDTKEPGFEKNYSIWTHISFNLVMVMLPATYGMFGTHFFWYYETEVLLPVIFVGMANVIYLLWDAFNDPLIGYISDKPNRLSRKYGRRFPYIVLFGIPTMVTLILLFIPPITNAHVNPIPVLLWAVIILIIHETGYTSVSLARALYPDKFRSDSERRKNAAMYILTYNLGLFLGLIIPMIVVVPGNIQSYWMGALILMIPCFICFLLGIPGVREDKEMIKRSLELSREPFFNTMKQTLNKKNFLSLIAVRISYQLFGACIMGSVYYYVSFILMEPSDSQADVLFMLAWFVAGLISIPFWVKLCKKTGNRNLQLIAVIVYVLASIPFIFIRDLTGAIITGIILGFMMGAITFIQYPIFSDIIDEASILDGKRQEGIYQGVMAFFDRFGIVLQPIIFTIVHIITGFNPEANTQTFLAQQGIIAAMTWIPALIMLITGLIFWKFYDLTPEKTEVNKKKLRDINL